MLLTFVPISSSDRPNLGSIKKRFSQLIPLSTNVAAATKKSSQYVNVDVDADIEWMQQIARLLQPELVESALEQRTE